MKQDNLLDRVTTDPAICFGKPCIKGTRIWVSLLLDNMAAGMSEKDLLDTYPGLVHADIMASLAYGALATREHIVPIDPAA